MVFILEKYTRTRHHTTDRGIRIWNTGIISIGYFEDGECSAGSYITIWSSGDFRVGEYYLKKG
jgi:hypothetical protein